MGANSRWALIKFSPFSSSVVCLFCNKAITTKREDVTKQGICKILWKKKKTSVFERVSYYLLFVFEWEEVGAYSRLGAY